MEKRCQIPAIISSASNGTRRGTGQGVAGSSSPLAVKGASLRAMLSQVLKLVHPPLEEKKHEICGGPVAKRLHTQCRGPRFHPWSGN